MSDKVIVPLGTLYPGTIITTVRQGNTISNQYPIWWEDTITIFNKYVNVQTGVVTWYKTILNKCFWKNTGNKVSVGEVVLDTMNTVCRIPKNDSFMECDKWKQLPNDEMINYFTLQPQDIVIKGSVEDIINEYESGKRATDIIKKYRDKGCIEIKQFSINTGNGKCLEHYYLSGT